MSGIDGVIQATLQNAQALNGIANDLPDSLPSIFLDTAAVLATTDVGDDATNVTVAGTTTVNDGGAGLYVRSSTPGPGTGLVQSADGQWWQFVSGGSITKGTAFTSGGGATSTNVGNAACTGTSTVLLQATSSDFVSLGPWVSSVSNGFFTVSHASSFVFASFAYIIV